MNIQLGSLTKSSSFRNISNSNQVTITIKDKSGSSVKSIKKTLNLPDTNNPIKKKKQLTPQQIAKRIAEGKSITPEQRKQIQSQNPALYAKAMMANQMRENLEYKLKNAKSETAQAQAVAQAMAQAMTMSKSEEQAGVPSQENGLPLYMDAIKQAIKNAAQDGVQKELNQMVEDGLAQYEASEGDVSEQDTGVAYQSEITGNGSEFTAAAMAIETISV